MVFGFDVREQGPSTPLIAALKHIKLAGKLALLIHYDIHGTASGHIGGCTDRWRDELVGDGLIEYDPDRSNLSDNDCLMTERGRAYTAMLLTTPLPVAAWRDPRIAA